MSLLGAHVSISGSVANAPENGARIGCEAIQIFSKNQRQWKAKPLTDAEAEAFKSAMEKHHIRAAMVHDSYLINLADPEEAGWKRSVAAFVDEMERCEALGIPRLVFHPGAPKEAGEEFGLKRIAEALDRSLSKAKAGSVSPLIENTAGQGSNVGWRFEHLRAILDSLSDPKRVGICIDTCHTFAGGYDIRTREGWEATLKEFDRVVGLEKIGAFHLNDSKKELNCRVDRHEHIGQGRIGAEPFRALVRDPRFKETPMALETPGEDSDFERNLKLLKRFRG
ncbi:MAG: deoxyribonuclease IV [Halobacteria archaeon]